MRSKRTTLAPYLLALFIGVLALTACRSRTPETSSMVDTAPTATTVADTAPTETTVADNAPTIAADLMVGSNEALGNFLVDGNGMTLYIYEEDKPGVSNCFDKCAEKWPPFVIDGEATLGDGVDAALVDVMERADGSSQVTYNGWPLYYWYKDVAPGDTLGQSVGDIWYVITPAGEVVH